MENVIIKKVAYHRNGTSGTGYHVVLFSHGKQNKNMVAFVFPESGSIAISDIDELAKGNIEFAKGNSWCLEAFEIPILAAVDKYERERSRR